MFIRYGPRVYAPILGNEGGTERLHLGVLSIGTVRVLYLAVRSGRRWYRKTWRFRSG